ncbi:hypothetical protein [Halobellus sp. Atlit-38R]|uniref:hypothetical protein n=1 Tax=Halobellus sp. Atlit-38R TaxID=2282131 RepID=UPI0011C344BE|nr:hypothetical protein [Halobellus sp. Atlit-38R]
MRRLPTLESVSRRSVLRTTGAVLGGAAIAGVGSADEIKPVKLDVKQESLNLKSRGVIPAEVAFPDGLFDELFPDGLFFPDDIFMGHRDQFALEEDPDNIVQDTDGVANPVDVKEIPGTKWLLKFRTQDIDFSEAAVENGKVEMVVAIENDGAAFGTDDVKLQSNPSYDRRQ